MGYQFACGPLSCTVKWAPDEQHPKRPPEVEELRRRRINEAWLSQGQVAERIGMDVVGFSRAENGRTAFTPEQRGAYRAALDAVGNQAAAREKQP